jgi:hypothetical protein
MRRNNENLYFVASLAIEDVVGKAQYSMKPNARCKLDTIPLWVLTDLDHSRLKGSKVAGAQSMSLLLVISDVLKVFNPRCVTEEVAHLSKAWA